MKDAFMRAHEAGDTAAAQALADGIRKEQSLATSRAASEKLDTQIATGADNPNSPVAEMGGLGRFVSGVGSGMGGKWLGAKQFAANTLGIGDKAALNAEAAEKERLDKPLTDTGMGSFGETVGKLVPDLLLGGGAGAVARKAATTFLPKVLPKLLPAVAEGAAAGAESGLTEADKNYDAAKQGGLGAAFGVAGDVLARGAGRVLSPRWESGKEAIKEKLANLKDVPLLAESVTNSKTLRALTNALEQIPVVGEGVKKTRGDAYGKITEDITGAAGYRTPELTDKAAIEMADRLAKQADTFRAGPDVPLTNMSGNLQTKLAELPNAGLSGGRPTAATKLERAIEASSSPGSPTPTVPGIFGTLDEVAATQPGPRLANTIEQAGADLHQGRGVVAPKVAPEAPPNVPTITAAQAMSMRSQATKAASDRNATQEARQAARDIRDELDNALEATMPEGQRAAYGGWKKEYGAEQKIINAGKTKEGYVPAEDFVKTLSKRAQLAPRTDLEKRVTSAAHIIPNPSLAENRSLMTRILMGSSIPGAGALLGGVGGAGSDNIPGGAATGVAGSLALAHLLLGTKGGGRYLTGKASSKAGKALQSELLRDLLLRTGRAGGGELAGGE
jgi:hypothetical protein